ncbi:MAG TPA: hypothetical protein VN442_15875 [Bryobacteraceae bacterium]|nr:hypothetical protein [Bryobacteraceae bacterium]
MGTEPEDSEGRAHPPRCILRVQAHPHVHPDRQEDVIVEVVRGGEVMATVYGSSEGLHIVSTLFEGGRRAKPFYLQMDPPSMAGIVVPLLQSGEECDRKRHRPPRQPIQCPVCQKTIVRPRTGASVQYVCGGIGGRKSDCQNIRRYAGQRGITIPEMVERIRAFRAKMAARRKPEEAA